MDDRAYHFKILAATYVLLIPCDLASLAKNILSYMKLHSYSGAKYAHGVTDA